MFMLSNDGGILKVNLNSLFERLEDRFIFTMNPNGFVVRSTNPFVKFPTFKFCI